MKNSEENSCKGDYPDNASLPGKTMLVVNTGSPNKRFILERIKQLGLTIVLLNSEKNWALPYVDHWVLADTYDHEASVESVRLFLLNNPHIHVDGAVTFWEDDVPLLARITKEFDFIGNSFQASINTRSKFFMQQMFRENGLPFIPQVLIKSEDDLPRAIEEVGFPAVIKPKYGSDSQYVVYVKDKKEAYVAYKYVLTECTPEFDPIYKYNKGQFVFQKFIFGKEFSVECYIQKGVPHVVGINEKTGMDLPFFVETGDYCPPRIAPAQKHMLIKTAEEALYALGVENSLAHIEIKLTDKGPQVIEVASRMGGVYIFKNINQVYGFDLIQAACKIACGIPVTEKVTQPQKHLLAKFFIPSVSGVIMAMSGFGCLRQMPEVIDCYIGKKVHDTIMVPPDGYEALGWVLTGGNSYFEAECRMQRIMNAVSFEVAPQKKPVRSGRMVHS